jgi:hypothetical protein
MLIDKLNTFSWEAAVTADAISDVIDLLSASGALNAGATGGPSANTIRDVGAGKTLYLHAVVTTTFDSAADSTSLITTLESDSAVGLDSSATVHWTSDDIEQATLVAGYWIAKGIPLPPGDYERYLGLRYNVGAEENFTAGKISAWISENRYDDRTYESGATTGVN